MLGDKVLDFGAETKCLGTIIDNQLTWFSHIELICSSFGQKVNQLKGLKYLTKDIPYSLFTLQVLFPPSLIAT